MFTSLRNKIVKLATVAEQETLTILHTKVFWLRDILLYVEENKGIKIRPH